jgi:hypothetical protein
MQDIGNLKSIIYGVVITIIFVISSCEWNVNAEVAESDSAASHTHTAITR